eukprot:EG_transcript_20523
MLNRAPLPSGIQAPLGSGPNSARSRASPSSTTGCATLNRDIDMMKPGLSVTKTTIHPQNVPPSLQISFREWDERRATHSWDEEGFHATVCQTLAAQIPPIL